MNRANKAVIQMIFRILIFFRIVIVGQFVNYGVSVIVEKIYKMVDNSKKSRNLTIRKSFILMIGLKLRPIIRIQLFLQVHNYKYINTNL